jgi:membrane-anchored protein YejM (alkaline phosphatase superfamily)
MRSHRIPIVTAAALCLTMLLPSPCCRKGPPAFNFILVTLDTTRADHLSCYSSRGASTPHLDALAEAGVLFESCFSIIPITLPAHAAMLYSLSPHEIHVYNNGDQVVPPPRRPSIIEIFQRHGFATAAFVSLGVLQSKFGLDAGFDSYNGHFPRNGRMFRTAGEINAEVFPWLENHRTKNFFIWVHYSDPHHPYYPPDLSPELTVYLNNRSLGEFHLNKSVNRIPMTLAPGDNELRLEIYNPHVLKPDGNKANFMRFNLIEADSDIELGFPSTRGWRRHPETGYYLAKKSSRLLVENADGPKAVELTFQGNLIIPRPHMRRLYRREVEYMDSQFGELMRRIEELGLRDRTRVLVVGDHGEGLGEYLNYNGGQDFGHINFLYDIYTRVPLIVFAPDLEETGLRVQTTVDLLDIAPTIMSLSGMNPLRHFQGRNVMEADAPRGRIFQATYRPQADRDTFAFLKPPLHLIFTPQEQRLQLFDLARDPEAKNDILPERSADPAIRELRLELERAARDIMKNKPEFKVDDNTREMLRALGYIK